MAESHSTVIENLYVTSEQASITLGGRKIHFKADPRSIAYSAFKELKEEIEAGYLAQRAPAPENQGLLSRLGSLLGNWFRTGDSSIKRDFYGETSAASSNHSTNTPPSRFQNAHGVAKAIFIDARGMLVRWQPSLVNECYDEVSARATEPIDLIFGHDSRAAESLRNCLRELARLGYPIVGIENAAAPDASTHAKSSERIYEEGPPVNPAVESAALTPPATSSSPPNGVETVAPTNSETRSAGGDGANDKNPQHPSESLITATKTTLGAEKLVVMRLRPSLPDSPTRALLASVESPEAAEVLVAPELLLRVLRVAAALPSTSEHRLTFFQCAKAENGLRIVNVGLGSKNEREPLVWRDAMEWWQANEKSPASATESPASGARDPRLPSPAERTYVCGQFPLGGAPVDRSLQSEAEPIPSAHLPH